MWRGYGQALARYGAVICFEWRRRGYKDNLLPWFMARVYTHTSFQFPPWLGDQALHATHRSALLAKNPTHYGKLGWFEKPAIDYYWPDPQDYQKSNVTFIVQFPLPDAQKTVHAR